MWLVAWIKKWGVRLGLLGEQGAESIHAYFNLLKGNYSSMPDGLQRMKQMMVEHHLYVAPANTTARPPVAKKKLSATSEDEHCFYIPSPWPSPFPFKLMY